MHTHDMYNKAREAREWWSSGRVLFSKSMYLLSVLFLPLIESVVKWPWRESLQHYMVIFKHDTTAITKYICAYSFWMDYVGGNVQ